MSVAIHPPSHQPHQATSTAHKTFTYDVMRITVIEWLFFFILMHESIQKCDAQLQFILDTLGLFQPITTTFFESIGPANSFHFTCANILLLQLPRSKSLFHLNVALSIKL